MWRLIPVVISCLLLAAHFFRADLLPLTIVCIIIAFLPFIRAAWIPRFMTFFLALAALEWIRTALVNVFTRIDLGQPWIRMLIILLAAALFTQLSAFVFRNRILSARYISKNKNSL